MTSAVEDEAPVAVTVPLAWHVSPYGRSLVAVLGATLILAITLGRPVLLVLAGAVAVALLRGLTADRPAVVRVAAALDAIRVSEGEPLSLAIDVAVDRAVGQLVVAVAAHPWCPPLPPEPAVVAGPRTTLHLRALRWGRIDLGPARVTAVARGRGLHGYATVPRMASVDVLPRYQPLRRAPAIPTARGPAGDRPSRVAGDGAEFAGIRPFGPGDRPRRVNWRVSARRHGLFVTEGAVEQAADVVLVIDAFATVGPVADTTLDRSVRAAAGLAQAWLAAHDRVGLLVTGGPLRWLAVAGGRAQLTRIAEVVLTSGTLNSMVPADVGRLPRRALPAGALVIGFSPLLDDRSHLLVRDLRFRGHRVVVVDVLGAPDGARGTVVDRLWALQRAALHHEMAVAGVPVLTWDPQRRLDVEVDTLVRRMPTAPAGVPR